MSASPFSWCRAWRTVADIRIDLVDLHADRDAQAQADRWLDHAEQNRRDRFLAPHARRTFVLCRAALRQRLCAKFGWDNRVLSFGAGVHGKPFAMLAGVPQQTVFNVSHSVTHGLIALGGPGAMGIDIEDRRAVPDLDGVAQQVFTAGEYARLLEQCDSEKLSLFFSIWTRKEAVMKATGEGFSRDPASFAVPDVPAGDVECTIELDHADPPVWVLRDLGTPQFAAALAYASPCQFRRSG